MLRLLSCLRELTASTSTGRCRGKSGSTVEALTAPSFTTEASKTLYLNGTLEFAGTP